MSMFQRLRGIVTGLVMLAVAVTFLTDPSDEAYMVIVLILTVSLLLEGLREIIFYFLMARHMIGGKLILIKGVITLDFALITGSIAMVPKIYIILYLAGIHAFSGVVEILRAMEAKKSVQGPWKMKFCHGLVNIALAAGCLIYIREPRTAVTIYSLGLIYSAVVRIITSFRRTTFVFID